MATLSRRGLFFGSLGLLFLPLVFVPEIYDSFELPKFLYLLLSFSLLLLLVAWQPETKTLAAPLVPLLFFYLSLFLSSATSRDPWSSFLGTYRRHEGFVSFTVYCLLSLIAMRHKMQEKDFFYLRQLFMGMTFIISCHALLQHFGLDIYGRAGMERSFSTLNHPNFLGAYLAMMLPFYLDSFICAPKLWQKVLYAIGYLLAFFALLMTFSRASWLAALASHAFFLWLYPFPRKKVMALSLLLAIFLLVAIGSFPGLSRSSFTLYGRFMSIFDPSNPSSAARLSTWKSALLIGRDHFFLGAGVDAYKNTFPQYKLENYVKFEGLHITADKAHNEFLHYFATLGVSGLFSYLWFLFALFLRLFRARKRDPSLTGLWISVLSAYLVQAFFSFSVITLGALFYFFAGMASCPVEEVEKKSSKKRQKRQSACSAILFITGLALLMFSLWFGALSLQADKYHLLARLSHELGEGEQGVFFARKSLKFPYTEDYWIYLGKNLELLAQQKKDRSVEYLNEAAKAFTRAIALYPNDAYLYSFRGKVYSQLSAVDGKKWQKKALQEMKKARSLDPHNPVFMNNLGAVYNKLDKPGEAVPWLKKSIKLSPNYLLAWSNLGVAYLKQKEYKKAERALKQALTLNPSHLPSLKAYLLVLLRQGKVQKAEQAIQNLKIPIAEDRVLMELWRLIRERSHSQAHNN